MVFIYQTQLIALSLGFLSNIKGKESHLNNSTKNTLEFTDLVGWKEFTFVSTCRGHSGENNQCGDKSSPHP